MTRLTHIVLLFAIFISGNAFSAEPSETRSSQKLPNIIVLITDDQGWGDIGYNNPENVYTPNLDRLARGGAIFANHYVMPQCTPTRVAAFTGRYPGRFGIEPLQASNLPAFPKGTPTLASMLKSAGYDTYLCGKWHMGSSPDSGPNHFGFDASYGSLAGAVGMYDHRYRVKESDYSITWHRDHEIIPGYENGQHATDLVAQDAIRYIKEERDAPFFLYLAFHAPHTPLDERGAFTDRPTQLDPDDSDRWLNESEIRWFNDPDGKIQKEADPEKRLLLAVVHHLDDAIGRVVDALDETGQREDTLILFSSDNGPQVSWGGNAYPCDLKLTGFNQPIPMRGSKCEVWEGGIHVPGFANWPGTIDPKTIDDTIHIIDWFPTLAAITGAQVDADLDGTDISPLLLGDGKLADRDLYWIWNRRTNKWALRHGDWKIVHYGVDEPREPSDWQLYNLKSDPQEKANVAAKYPEKREELHALYLKQRAKDAAK